MAVDHTAIALTTTLRVAMKAAGVTSSALSDTLGVTDQAVGKWLRTGNVARQHLPALARSLSVDIDWLLTGVGRGPAGSAPPPRYTLDTLPTHVGPGDALLDIVTLDNAPDFLPGDIVTFRPLVGQQPQSRHVAVAGRCRAGIRSVIHDADGPVLINVRTGATTPIGDACVIGDLIDIYRTLLTAQPQQ